MQFASAASTVLSPLNLIFSVAVLSGVSEACFADITIGTVAIGNAGNASDPITARGAVSYAFNIGATEVTNAQYAAFLNAKAATDTYSLYNTEMAGTYGGINRSGTAGSYTYSTVSGRADNPVNFVSYWDSLRFANWLHNGQGSGATETGAYTLTSSGISANSIARNSDWRWAVTSDNEWYKAAYHQPASEGGPSDNYWLYPMGTDSIPSDSEANINNVVGNTVAVGSYAANFYGTFDMAGNVMEWTEAAMTSSFGSYRFLRGGSFTNYYGDIRSNWYFYEVPTAEDRRFGFRVSQIPSPASFALLSLGMLGPRGRRSRAAR
ncbi:MAG: formylglycine-generating enzyme family protein [bacterium]